MKALSKIIGSRVLTAGSGKHKRRVTVRLGVPRRFKGGYRCHYQIKGLGDDSIRFGAGVDSIQALQIALQNIGAELYLTHRRAKLRLEGLKDLGFPKPTKWM